MVSYVIGSHNSPLIQTPKRFDQTFTIDDLDGIQTSAGQSSIMVVARKRAPEDPTARKLITMAILGGNKGQAPEKAAAPSTAPATPAPAAPSVASKRGPKPGVERKPLSLDLGGLEVAPVTDPQEMAKARRVRGERSPDQKRLDAMVENAWKAWKDAGEPSEWPKMPGVKIRIGESQFETLQAGIRKAGQFYDLKVRFGKVEKTNGVCEVVFVVTDRPAKDDKSTNDDENEE